MGLQLLSFEKGNIVYDLPEDADLTGDYDDNITKPIITTRANKLMLHIGYTPKTASTVLNIQTWGNMIDTQTANFFPLSASITEDNYVDISKNYRYRYQTVAADINNEVKFEIDLDVTAYNSLKVGFKEMTLATEGDTEYAAGEDYGAYDGLTESQHGTVSLSIGIVEED